MNQDEYWKCLVGRVHRNRERLSGAEDQFYRLSCIFGETMVDGLESYFDRRFAEFDSDMKALVLSRFLDVQLDYFEAKNLLFGSSALDQKMVASVMTRLLKGRREDQELLARLGIIYDRLVTRLPDVAVFRDGFGVVHGLYE